VADFCKLHSIEVWGEDMGDLAGLSTPEDTTNGLYAPALCETCGIILVDHTGEAVVARLNKPWATTEDETG
jgi:hypothetical protein